MPVDKRIRWRCRRGLKELDVLMERFLDRGYAQLGATDKAAFERLLEALDPDLLGWLTGRSLPADQELAKLVMKMRPVVLRF